MAVEIIFEVSRSIACALIPLVPMSKAIPYSFFMDLAPYSN
jgi:hypothetical protein